jgi:GNAT superfamily N-acetyltransferase
VSANDERAEPPLPASARAGAACAAQGGAAFSPATQPGAPASAGVTGEPGGDRLDIAIRPAVAADVPLVLRFIRELAEYERLADEVVATEDGLRLTLFGEAPRAEVVFAMAGGEAAGFALFFHNYSTFLGQLGLYLEDLYVRPELRGRGVGRALLSHLARLAVERGCGRLEWSVLDWNETALAFYRSLGARPTEGWTVHRLAGDALDRLAAPAARAGGREPEARSPGSPEGGP